MTPTTQAQIVFTGPTLDNVAAQVQAYAAGLSTAAPTTKANPVVKTTKKTAAPAAVEAEAEETDLLSAGEAEEIESDETDAADLLAGAEDEESFDDVADEAANAKSTPAKNAAAKKAPKATLKDVNAALINYMKVTGKKKAEVQALLKKKFKVESVNELKESDYSVLITAVTPPKK